MSTDLVVFGEDWGRHPSSTQHLVKRLAADWSVLWINSIGLRRPQLTKSDLCRVWAKGKAMLSKPKPGFSIDPAPFPVVQPRVIPWPGNPLAGWANGQLLAKTLKPKIRRSAGKRPILWTSLPSAVDVIGKLDERAVVYYVGDDFGALAGVDHRPILDAERRLADQADLIIAASQRIAAKFDPVKTKVLHHGINADFLKPVLSRPPDLPEGPVAGFFGSLSDWLDTALLDDLAARMPDWNFVFVGEERTDLAPLKMRANIHFLGVRDHAVLPAYAQHWDVSLIPFRDTPQIRACNPLKLREYMACGRPIVTTDFPALNGYRDDVSVAHDAASFEAKIRKNLPKAEISAARQTLVAHETWDARAATLSSWLQDL